MKVGIVILVYLMAGGRGDGGYLRGRAERVGSV